MEKDIGKIKKNENTEIIVRIDDFGGKTGGTIREFVTGERYTGFTKAGTRIPADKFLEFRELVNKINLSELTSEEKTSSEKPTKKSKTVKEEPKKEIEEDY